jgi:ATP-dependent exoDNAse (exonuclease V) beta subunit
MNILAKNLLILASAGSGKTFQLGNRVIGLVARGAEPERIVALTFTRKAAGEFADSVLTKLAEAASENSTAASLREELALPEADFKIVLARVIRALPQITLGTMDGFFAKIVRGFQYELGLTGGKFDLLEGPRASALTDEMLADILGDVLAREDGDEFFHAFRRATIGREDQSISRALREFVTRWHGRYRESPDLDWGPPSLSKVNPDEWSKQKSAMAAMVLRGLDDIEFNRKGQREALEKEIANLENHVIGGGSLGGKITSLMASILDAVATQKGPLLVKSYKEFTIGGAAGDALRSMVELAAHCEFSAALSRTRALREVVSVFDSHCAKRLRHRGLLGFNDVKILMGAWARNEDSRLRREAVDFRLDARIDHWLLDEFQDTSRSDWTGLLPLIDEAATDDDGSMFIVGDRKQAIYAWRGGDVSLFDEVIARYGSGLEIAPMAESWRSCPEVLALVNRICGDVSTLHELFGEAATKWDWQDHFPAKPLAKPEKRGQARVEMVGNWEERLERLAEILRELGVGQRAMTCGVLLRGNEKARQVADDLRNRGFDVIEEGRRLPGKDNPVGLFITNLLKWLADPADAFAQGVLEMSPLSEVLHSAYGPNWSAIWAALSAEISIRGYSPAIGSLLGASWNGWSDFGRRRAGDLLAGLASLDHQGGVSAKEAADWMERLELSQSPGVAAVQVMTIHKAKGLGFDVVILPEIPDEGIPQAQYFDVAENHGWLTQTPPKWVRAIIPELLDAESQWSSNQRYEAFCMLYVALTRAKRGLYVLLDPPSKSSDPEKPSLSNWLIRSVGEITEDEILHQTGTDDWTDMIPIFKTKEKADEELLLGIAAPRRIRKSPSGKKSQQQTTAHSPAGMQFGTEVHALFEQIAWIDDTLPILPESDAGHAVKRVLRNSRLRDVFVRGGRNIDLFNEQAMDLVDDGKLISGVIDRLHLHRDENGRVTRVEIIDFKTDAVKESSQLAKRYSEQMNAYRDALQLIHPAAEIVCALLSVRHGELVFL